MQTLTEVCRVDSIQLFRISPLNRDFGGKFECPMTVAIFAEALVECNARNTPLLSNTMMHFTWKVQSLDHENAKHAGDYLLT